MAEMKSVQELGSIDQPEALYGMNEVRGATQKPSTVSCGARPAVSHSWHSAYATGASVDERSYKPQAGILALRVGVCQTTQSAVACLRTMT